MWKFTVVAEANPTIILGVAFAGITCFISRLRVSFAAITTSLAIWMPSIDISNVADVAAVLATKILVTIVVVDVDGTVYSVALDVDAAVLASTFVTVAISYYLSLLESTHKDES